MEKSGFIPILHEILIDLHTTVNLINNLPWYKKLYYKYFKLGDKIHYLKWYIKTGDIYSLFEGLVSIQYMFNYNTHFILDSYTTVSIYNNKELNYTMIDVYGKDEVLLISAGPVKNVNLYKEINVNVLYRVYKSEDSYEQIAFTINRYNDASSRNKDSIVSMIREILYKYMKSIMYKGDLNE